MKDRNVSNDRKSSSEPTKFHQKNVSPSQRREFGNHENRGGTIDRDDANNNKYSARDRNNKSNLSYMTYQSNKKEISKRDIKSVKSNLTNSNGTTSTSTATRQNTTNNLPKFSYLKSDSKIYNNYINPDVPPIDQPTIMELECVAGYDGGLTQYFILEAYDSRTKKLRLNITSAFSDIPIFRIDLTGILNFSNQEL